MKLKLAAIALTAAFSVPAHSEWLGDIFFPWMFPATAYTCQRETPVPTQDNSPQVRLDFPIIPVTFAIPNPHTLTLTTAGHTWEMRFQSELGYDVLTWYSDYRNDPTLSPDGQSITVTDIDAIGIRLMYVTVQPGNLVYRCVH